jgi:thioesterase domain-containing protein
MACQLEAQGQKIALLALMDTQRPTGKAYFRYRLEQPFKRAKQCINEWVEYYLVRLAYHRQQLRQHDWPSKLSYVLRNLPKRAAEIYRPDWRAPAKQIRQVQKIQEVYVDTLRRYRPGPYRGRMSLILNEVSYSRDPTLGWSSLVSGKIDAYKARGDHDAYIREHVQAVAKQLRDCLEKATNEI